MKKNNQKITIIMGIFSFIVFFLSLFLWLRNLEILALANNLWLMAILVLILFLSGAFTFTIIIRLFNLEKRL